MTSSVNATAIVNLEACLYTHGSKDALWTGQITVNDPQYVGKAATSIARAFSQTGRNTDS